MSRPIALLTDFGTADAYVGSMKGVLLSRCPDARLIDLTHEIPPQDVLGGALQLAAAAPYCPADTVFLAVVDPGVGSDRRPLCIRSGTRLFVGPDNGLLCLGALAVGAPEAFHLDRREYWLPSPSATFHGRDLFAPIAAALAKGTAPEQVGSPINDPRPLALPQVRVEGESVAGEVIYVDHFGNSITNLRFGDLPSAPPESLRFRLGQQVITGLSTHYAARPRGVPVVLLSSAGYVEVAVNGDSAAARLSLRPGSGIQVDAG